MGDLRFDERVVIVTGAGNGLGKSHALAFAARGAKVLVNDLGGAVDGTGGDQKAADAVVAEIRAAGGTAEADYHSVTEGEAIVQAALGHWGRIDVVVNNAGILRDVSFHKMSEAEWDAVYDVHLKGAFAVTHAAWPHMRDAQYGRVIFTSSAAGLYGNFGQANYGAAKLAQVGMMNTLAVEGRKRNIFVNAIAPVAKSRMTEDLLPPMMLAALEPERVTPLVVLLAHEESEETGGVFELGGGFVSKLRWERSEGMSYRLGRAITPESLRDDWDALTDFASGATHPQNIQEALAPIATIATKGPSLGANKYIDADAAHGYAFSESSFTYDKHDLALYATTVGAGTDPVDSKELQYVFESHAKGFRAVPSFAVIPALNEFFDRAEKGEKAPGLKYGLDRVLHGAHRLELTRPLPARKTTLTQKTTIKDIFDKGKHALVVSQTKSYDEDGDLLVINDLTTLVRGAGGFGGPRGAAADLTPPEREPDHVVEQATAPDQAIRYRLNGDWNPLHVDPGFAKMMRFERPILHGLATYGFAVRHLISAFCPDGDPRYFKAVSARFSKSVYPGDTLRTKVWKVSETKALYQVEVVERGEVCIDQAEFEIFSEIPKKS